MNKRKAENILFLMVVTSLLIFAFCLFDLKWALAPRPKPGDVWAFTYVNNPYQRHTSYYKILQVSGGYAQVDETLVAIDGDKTDVLGSQGVFEGKEISDFTSYYDKMPDGFQIPKKN